MTRILEKRHEGLHQPSTTPAFAWPGNMSTGDATTSDASVAVLNANRDELLLRGKLGDFRIPRASVVRINRGQMYPWMFAGFRIRHTAAGVPPELQFKPKETSSREVLAQLKQLGFPVG